MKVKAKIPNRVQAGISQSVYDALSVNPQCSRLGNPCSEPCQKVEHDGTYKVELDHIVPRSQGGSNNIDNLQWLCACKNKEKYNKPDVNYMDHLYFDNEIDVSRLRPHQQQLAYGLAVKEYREIFENPSAVLPRFMLLAWMVGAGKTIGMLSILFGINHVRKQLGNGSAKRIKKVLWLVHQRSLVTALKDEIETELTQHGIAAYRPSVECVEESGHWSYHADIIVSCPQALWDVKNRRLNEEDRSRILSQFDAIVVDEAHFAMDHYLSLSKLAPTAFKFAITATPIDRVGNLFCDMDHQAYRDWFVLYSKFGYQTGMEIGIYKKIVPYEEGLHKYYFPEKGGDAVIRQGESIFNEDDTRVRNNLARSMAILNSARNKAVAADMDTPYDNHIMVRCGSINEAKGIVKACENYGDAVGVWSGSGGAKLGSIKHPWMKAKTNKGKIPKDGARIVVTVDIGQFGINNPYCSFIVWLSPNNSLIEIVQRIGRAIRGVNDPNAKVRLIWNGADDAFSQSIAQAVEYILEMDSRMDGFIHMSDMNSDTPMITATPAESPVLKKDRVAISNLIGERIEAGDSFDKAMTSAIKTFTEDSEKAGRKLTESYVEKIGKYADVLSTPEGRDKALHVPSIFQNSSICLSEKPTNDYSIERLCSAIESGEVSNGLRVALRQIKIKRLVEGDELTIEEVKSELKANDEKARLLDDLLFYEPYDIAMSPKDKTLRKNFPIESYRDELFEKYKDQFFKKGHDIKDLDLTLRQVIPTAIRHYYGMPNFQRKTYQPYAKQLSDAMLRESERRIMVSLAEALLIERNLPPLHGMSIIYKDQIAQLKSALALNVEVRDAA